MYRDDFPLRLLIFDNWNFWLKDDSDFLLLLLLFFFFLLLSFRLFLLFINFELFLMNIFFWDKDLLLLLLYFSILDTDLNIIIAELAIQKVPDTKYRYDQNDHHAKDERWITRRSLRNTISLLQNL